MAKARKHPFHWDVYNDLLDRLERVIDSEDARLDETVRSTLIVARAAVYAAWEQQAAIEQTALPANDPQAGLLQLSLEQRKPAGA